MIRMPESERKNLMMTAAIYGGLFLGEVLSTLIRLARQRTAPEPDLSPAAADAASATYPASAATVPPGGEQ